MTQIPSLTDKEGRALATQIVKDGPDDTLVRFGRTNGLLVLHVTAGRKSFTIKSAGEWVVCPLNDRLTRNEREAKQQPTEALMAANGS